MHWKTRRPSAGTLIGTVALVFAITGAAVALPGKNTVNSGDIKNGQVKTKDIGANQVKTRDIGAGQVGTSDVNAASVGGKFGSGILAGAGTAPAVGGNVASLAQLPATGSGGVEFDLMVPRGGLTLRDLVATIDGPSPRTIVVGLERNNDNAFLSCTIPPGLTSCQSTAEARLALDAGDVADANMTVVPNPVAVGATDVSFAYRAVPR